MKRSQRASLSDVWAKVGRAKLHCEEFDDRWTRLVESKAYRFVGQMHRNGLDHVYRADHPPDIGPDWGAIAGDCVHNLRSALDHLAWQLVLRSQNTPSMGTQFPVRRSWLKRNPCSGVVEPTPLLIAGGVLPALMEVVDDVQPYKRTDASSHPLALIHELDVIDKHRHIVLTATTVRVAGYIQVSDGVPPVPLRLPFTIRFTRKPLKHGEVVARVVYPAPRSTLDKNLHFMPDILFDKRGPAAVVGQPVAGVLLELISFVKDDLIPRFQPFFP